MNLGDGLKLETQILNGKTRLILAPYGVQEKTSKQLGNKGRIHKAVLKVKTPAQILHSEQGNNAKTEHPHPAPKLRSRTGSVPSGKPPGNVLKELENKHHATIGQQNAQQTKADNGKPKSLSKKLIVPKQRLPPKPAISAEQLRESLVCLTQEQFQQILMTINQGSKQTAEQDETADSDVNKQETQEESTSQPLTEEQEENDAAAEQGTRMQTGSLFGTLGERQRDKSLEEAKKAQWRRELDEQVALKKKLKEAEQDGINRRHHELHDRESSISQLTPFSELSKNTPPNDYGTPDQEDVIFKASTSMETTESSPVGRTSSFSSPELPAAIRSAFVLGEAAPLDHPFSALKRQQQKKWLEDLNKQREEAAVRKMQEKQKFQEAMEEDHWAKHFDSFKKKLDYQPPVCQNMGKTQTSESPTPMEQSAIESPATTNLQQEKSDLLKLTEEEQFQKTGFLRTMTALLDPAQIEERDRKRQKQLEHQKAIAAQVEENRKRKQLEEEQRKREEQEEERRLAKEQEQMQKQYEEDSFKQKLKEEVLTQKTRELYQSMQRAQEEAQRLKQEQRMRHLIQKGHDVSNLQKNTSGDSVHVELSRAASCSTDLTSDDYRNVTNSVMKSSVTAPISPRKDTAVQTDDLETIQKAATLLNSNEIIWRQQQNASPDVPIEFNVPQSKAGIPTKNTKPLRDVKESSKENTNNHNVYDQFARTEKQGREHGRKPDWNKSKPRKKYIPASERYPRGVQRQREENKARRQIELLHLVEKNSSNLQTRKGNSLEKSPSSLEEVKVSPIREDLKIVQEVRKEEKKQKVDSSFKRPDSPPVPAVKNRLYLAQKKSNLNSVPSVYYGDNLPTQRNVSPEQDKQDSERPPSSKFIPYVRTKEIYYLDPDAPMSRPSTHDPQYRKTGAEQESRQIFSSDHARDPLLNPNVVRNKDRQQAILRGLSELRKGLLQKQRELETGLMPDV